jgi:hypothetical protein
MRPPFLWSRLFAALAVASMSFTSGSPTSLGAPEESKEPTSASSKYPPGYVEEGPLPQGFPPPSEVGQVVEKSYPLCRTYSAEGNNAFMRCFTYLVQEKHEMTAPVIMSYQKPANNAAAPRGSDFDFMDVRRMHFILEEPSLDEPKEKGQILVADMPKMRVLSIAFQGKMTADALEDAERKLDAELARREGIVAAGPKRVLGYNSPMVPKGKAYWEIQVPIEDRAPAAK